MEYNKQTAYFFNLTEKTKRSYYETLDLNRVITNNHGLNFR